MTTSKVTTPQPAMTEIKQSIVKRVSLKVSPKLPKLSRSTSSPTSQATTTRYSITATRRSSLLSSSANSIDSSYSIQGDNVLTKVQEIDKENFKEENSQEYLITIKNNDSKGDIKLTQSEESNNQEAPVLMRKLTKAMSSSTTKTQNTNVAAVAKTLPKNLIRSLRDSSKKDNQTPIDTLITTPSLSPPAVSQISYTSSTMVGERKKKNRRSRSGSFSTTAQALSNMLKRRSKNRSGSNDFTSKTNEANGAPALTYESFPDPDPDDFFNVYSWDIPDSIVSIEDAGGVLQMIEYDGIFINGIKIH
ncbi:hypothetical protein RclHR1_09010007 [Rhizophagus clarus]|uniref:Uncharacterized protein n=1 Tax=Rhizophagus clarus TaxID=94130 RepID=A0A2Z6S2Z9_9GLOM|nr:hypothetical protein RclHR1_09010007 [Rhizophagus clarus]GES73942.1 hypothetical protein GLOIN_2v1497249 [Rhizophagus clarus]